ncbi:hypothetical protein ACGFIF_44195 [Kribbella sp. NPDC049174]|uniref:hypothetical protein n=1 Tax=Kribbella sp. NPDC049174 TaxID=3364112 RepID=UPI00371636D3
MAATQPPALEVAAAPAPDDRHASGDPAPGVQDQPEIERPAATTAEAPAAVTDRPAEVASQRRATDPAPAASPPPARPAKAQPSSRGKVATLALPDLSIDPADPSALLPSPTSMSIPGSIMRRFEAARDQAPSHTVLVLDAIRATVHDLPDLVVKSRPSARPGDLFPARPAGSAGTTVSTGGQPDHLEQLRLRPTVAELVVIDRLCDWVTAHLRALSPRARKVSRSELVSVALSAYLPPASSQRAG